MLLAPPAHTLAPVREQPGSGVAGASPKCLGLLGQGECPSLRVADTQGFPSWQETIAFLLARPVYFVSNLHMLCGGVAE